MISRNSIGSAFPTKRLSEVVEFLDSKRRPVTESDRRAGPFPYYGANGIQGTIDEFIFDEPLVLLAEDGGHFGDPARGIAYRISGKTWVNNHAHVLRPTSAIELAYLCRVLENYDVTPFVTGTTRGKLTKAGASEIVIPLPPLAEQRRIAEVLDRAEALRAKRRAALAQLDSLTQSLFLDLFGDPLTNPKGWPQVEFGELLTNIDSGWSPVCQDRPVMGHEWGVLKLGAITRCEFDPTENKALPAGIEPDRSIEVKSGDLLFARKNTHELVAACVLVRETPPHLMMSDLVFRFRLRPDSKVEPMFLQQLLVYPTKRRDIQKLARGSSGSMPNISKARLQKTLIELPPISLQREFAQRVTAVEELKKAHRASLTEMDALFASLQHRAFRGEL